jgi:cell volume regulation protein A
MVLTAENILFIGSILLFISILAGRAANLFGVPVLLLFLTVGMVFGSDGLGIQFSNPHIAQFIGNAALSIILFSGGMDTKFSEIKPVLAPGVALSTLGVLLTTLFTAIIIYYFTSWLPDFPGLSIAESLLLASIMSSTDSASVFSILRSKQTKLKQNLKPLLELESGSNDPMAYMLTILFIEMIVTGETGVGTFIFKFVVQFAVGALSGYLLSKLLIYLTRNITLQNNSAYHILLLASVFFIQSGTGFIYGNGFLAVYIAGLVIGNNKNNHNSSANAFFDSFAWLSQLVLFLTLGLFVNPGDLFAIASIGLIIAFGMTLFSRPFSVFLALIPFRGFSLNARHYISWVGLKGAVPIVFATYPLIAGLKNAQLMFDIVFFVTLLSLLIQGTTVFFSAKRLSLISDGSDD